MGLVIGILRSVLLGLSWVDPVGDPGTQDSASLGVCLIGRDG
ncbi:hypothetical protein ANMWB30_40690 [Arthrobacter sp. MWB30]|nr:hypothetical protein ANMWB30_40690 [Arthrobacter sp. MWB30]